MFLFSKPTEDFGITLVYFATLEKKKNLEQIVAQMTASLLDYAIASCLSSENDNLMQEITTALSNTFNIIQETGIDFAIIEDLWKVNEIATLIKEQAVSSDQEKIEQMEGFLGLINDFLVTQTDSIEKESS